MVSLTVLFRTAWTLLIRYSQLRTCGGLTYMRYRIKYAPDDLMPRGHDWLLCRTPWVVTVFLRRSMVLLDDDERASILEEAWEGYRTMVDQPPNSDLISA